MADLTAPSSENLQQICSQLESLFRSLTTIQAIIRITSEVLAEDSADVASEVALVLMRCASDPLHEEMKVLTSIIEGLGGKTGYSDDDEDEDDDEDT